MENINENPIAEEAVVESPVVEEAPVVEAPAVEETHAEPVVEEEPAQETPEVPALAPVANGVMGSTTVPRPERSHQEHHEDSVEKIAIYSTSNVNWEGVGKVYKGYNIVTKDASEQWLTRSHVRIATPEEVKKAFG